MKLRSARSLEQMRLWVYCVMVMLVVVRSCSGMGASPEFVMFGLVGVLFYTEFCPVYGRLCWWELSALRKWPNVLWIGIKCRHHSSEAYTSPTNFQGH